MVLSVLIIWFSCTGDIYQPVLKEDIKTILKKRMDTTVAASSLLNSKSLFSPDLLLKYYKKNDYFPAWIGKNGQLPIADSLIANIKESVFDGLNPSDYHLSAIEALQKELIKYEGESTDSTVINKWLDFELLLSDAFFTYTIHQYAGRIHSEKYNTEWKDHMASINVIDSLKNATEKNRIWETMNSFSCIHPQYKKLKTLLKRYIDISKNGGWPLLPNDTRLKSNDKNITVKLLRKRLLISGELTEAKANPDTLFDNTLVEAVKNFQRRYGLKDNGTIDLITLNELNIPVESRIKQIVLNMERWRWFPRIITQPYILVNTAGFRLEVVENNEVVMDMKIVAGMSSHHTPVFSTDMTYIILNPWWEIPMSIARKEILPEITAMSSSIASSGMGGMSGATKSSLQNYSSTNSEQIREGMYVNKGQTLFAVNDFKEVWAVISIDAKQQSKIEINGAVKIKSEVAEGNVTAKINFIEPYFQNGSKYSRVRVYLSNEKNLFKLNLFITAQFNFSINGLMVLSAAIMDLGNKKVVWLKTGTTQNGKTIYKIRIVETGAASKDFTEIKSGLSANDEVASNAGYLLDSEGLVNPEKHQQ